jgi:tRNA (mo5U34)-methyltransferase
MPVERPAGNPRFSRLIQDQVSYLSCKGWYHSIELPDGNVIQGLIGLEALKGRMATFPIPEDLTGKRVLDIGAWTGWCSFEMERRGAEVVAVDCIDFEEFRIAHRMMGSAVDYRVMDVDELSPETVGLFDYVLCFGVFYHLRNPLLGMEKICAITKEAAFVESFVTDEGLPSDDSAPCLMEFYETNELGGQIDNWYGPTTKCLLAMCRSAGFARANLELVVDRRAAVTCRRHWESPASNPTQPAPWVNSAVNNRTNDIYFHKGKDEYVCLYFKTPEKGLAKDQVRVEVDGYGVATLALADLGRNGWQANFRLPPGLAIGTHEVRVRTVNSPFSNAFQIAMLERYEAVARAVRHDREVIPPESATEPAPFIYEVENSMTETVRFHGYKNEYLCCRFRTPETRLLRDDVILEVDRVEEPVLFLTDLGRGAWQTNSKLPADLRQGPHNVRVRTVHSPFSNEAEIFFEPEAD